MSLAQLSGLSWQPPISGFLDSRETSYQEALWAGEVGSRCIDRVTGAIWSPDGCEKPEEGWALFCASESRSYVYHGGEWVVLTSVQG